MYANEDLENLSPEEKGRKRREIQIQMIMLESDGRKLTDEKNLLDVEIRKIKIDSERLRVNMDEKKTRLGEVSSRIFENEEEIKKLKKKMNLL